MNNTILLKACRTDTRIGRLELINDLSHISPKKWKAFIARLPEKDRTDIIARLQWFDQQIEQSTESILSTVLNVAMLIPGIGDLAVWAGSQLPRVVASLPVCRLLDDEFTPLKVRAAPYDLYAKLSNGLNRAIALLQAIYAGRAVSDSDIKRALQLMEVDINLRTIDEYKGHLLGILAGGAVAIGAYGLSTLAAFGVTVLAEYLPMPLAFISGITRLGVTASIKSSVVVWRKLYTSTGGVPLGELGWTVSKFNNALLAYKGQYAQIVALCQTKKPVALPDDPILCNHLHFLIDVIKYVLRCNTRILTRIFNRVR